ncbi:MAG: HEPN domain-containing protein [Spirochaetes bacterium]|nr:HEPN domain-containing protein [Spirochaetota bacterium]
MIFNTSMNTLLKEGLIKKSSVDFKAITSLIHRAFLDIKTAERNLDQDEECAYNYAYSTMLRCGLAIMFSEGFRPQIKDKHLTIVKFAGSVIGKEYKDLINNYDFMRRKRNRFIYEPDIPCSKKEAKDALKTAKDFFYIVQKHIKKKNPQLEFDL